MSRLSPVTLLVLVVANAALAAPPDEIRVSSLGARGTTFSDEWPGTFADNRFDGAVSPAGDVNGDGFADMLILHQDFVDFHDDRPAADTTDDGKLDLTDAVYVLGHLFLGGPAPAAPFPEAGQDATPDTLDCRGQP